LDVRGKIDSHFHGNDIGERGKKLKGKIVNHMVTNCNVPSKLSPSIVTNCNVDDDKMSSCMVQKLHPNNNNLNKNITTTNRKKSAVVAVNFKKIKIEDKRESIGT